MSSPAGGHRSQPASNAPQKPSIKNWIHMVFGGLDQCRLQTSTVHLHSTVPLQATMWSSPPVWYIVIHNLVPESVDQKGHGLASKSRFCLLHRGNDSGLFPVSREFQHTIPGINHGFRNGLRNPKF